MTDYTDIIEESSEGIPRIRQGVGIIVFANTRYNEVFLSKRTGGGEFDGLWQNPGGKLEPGEAPNAGANRELKEETGLVRLFLPSRNFITTLGKNVRGHYLFHWFYTTLRGDEIMQQIEPTQNTLWVPVPIADMDCFTLMPNLHAITLIAQARMKGTL